MLRQFLYLNRPLVREFLAQLEGGVFDETRERTSQSGTRGASAKVGTTALGGGIDRAKTSNAESEAVIKQTSASEFDRLYGSLEADGLQVYDIIDAKLEDLPIRRKEIIEVDATLRVSGLQTVLDLVGTFGKLMPFMEELGAAKDLDPEAISGMQAIAALNVGDRPISLVATVAGEGGLQLALDLSADGVLTDDWNIDATVLLKVQRVLRPGDRHVVGDPFGGLMSILPEAERSKLLASLDSESLRAIGVGESDIGYPGLIGTPIAIYR